MKVLFVMHGNDYYSGANLAMQEVIVDLKDKIDCSVLFPSKVGSSRDYFRHIGINTYDAKYWHLLLSKKDSFLKNFLKCPLLLFRYIVMRNEARRVSKLFNDIDIVYTNTGTIQFGLMISSVLGIKHVWHIREFADRDHGFIFPIGKKRYYSLVNRVPGCVIVISKCLKESIETIINNTNVLLIYDDVSKTYINPKTEIKKSGDINILIAGDIKPGKGQLIVLHALKLLPDRFHLYIAGKTGDIRYKQKMDKFINDNQLSNRITFLGHVRDMNSLRKDMDIGVVASDSEAFGRVTVEGMLSGMAMIGRNSGATPEIIVNNKTGLLFDGTVEDLAKKINDLSNPELRKKITTAGFESALKYANNNCSQKILSLLNEVYENGVI